jgi:hypothetical protein
MNTRTSRFLVLPLLLPGLVACVQPYVPKELQRSDVLVVEGALTDLPETQVIKLILSKGDSLTGLPGTRPIEGARVEVVVDSARVLALRETDPGNYRLPADFRAQVGHRYQLRFTLRDGRRYASSVEVMPAAPPIQRVYDRFNPRGVAVSDSVFWPSNDLFIDVQDPPGVPNQYRWDWTLWERQEICHSCQNGEYFIYDAQGKLLEDCVPDPRPPGGFVLPVFREYVCRTPCWEILPSVQLRLFADTYTDGGLLKDWRVGAIPFYQNTPALVELRQSALTPGAYRYYKLLDDQTQKNGGLVDTPPVPPIGNVRSLTNEQEHVVGYFTASSVAAVRYWLDRRANTTPAIGLFEALNGRAASVVRSSPIRGRPPLALCAPGPTRTPVMPAGWRE